MGDTLLTRASLLARLGDPKDRAAWQEFVELYASLVYGFVRQRGLQDADAADLTQEVLLAVAQAMGRWQYDRAQGTFRGWLYGITRHKLARFLRRRGAQFVASGDSSARRRLDQQPNPGPTPEDAWEQEYRQQLFRLAAGRVRDDFAPTTWQAFWRTAVEGKNSATVAAELGLSVGAIYVARSRVLARLVEAVRDLEAEGSGE
jgi:RNA polymerase sigma-70 factor (ECF subfamily)